MIEFRGEISEACKKYIWKKETQAQFFAILIVSIFFIIVTVVVALLYYLIVLLFLILLASFIIFGSIPQKGIEKRVPKEISIVQNRIYLKSDSSEMSRELSDIKAVKDMGDWYDIQFCLPYCVYFVCEKSLLAEGTLEEFENLFEGKIVRKQTAKI